MLTILLKMPIYTMIIEAAAMELWELNAILDIEMAKAEADRDYQLIRELCAILGVDVEGL